MFGQMVDLNTLSVAIGSVIVNVDLGDGTTISRANKDAEVTGAALIAYWTSSVVGGEANMAIIKDQLSDLVLDARRLGVGSKFRSEILKLVAKEERSREVQGDS